MLSLALAAITIALAPADPAQCTRQHPPSGARLEAIVRELHPDALQPTADSSTTIVGVVLDSACTVQRHAVTTWSGGTITPVTTLAEMFPGIRAAPFEISGIAQLDGTARGRTVVVWAVAPSLVR
jgi:hypothetical protein